MWQMAELSLCCVVLCLMWTGAAGSIACDAGMSPEYVEHVEVSINDNEALCQPHISGIYRKTQQVLNGRPTYSKQKGEDFDEYHIYYVDTYWGVSFREMGGVGVRAYIHSSLATVPSGNWNVGCLGNAQLSSLIFRLYDEFESCTQCPAGKFKEMAGNTECEVCPTGQFNDMAGITECEACPAPQTTAGEGSTSASDCLCVAGSLAVFVDIASVSGGGQCQSTLDGQFTKNEAQYNGRPSYSSPGGVLHIYYIYNNNHLWLISRSMGSTMAMALSNSASTTVPLSNWDVRCGTGTGWTSSAVAIRLHTDFDACETCPTGTFLAIPGDAACKSCPGGQTTAAEGTTSAQDCMCAAGSSPAYVEQAVVSGGNPCQGPINGVYTRNDALYNARPTYSKPGPGARHIYYVFRPSTQRYLWVISPSIGAVVFNAICQTNSTMVPLQNWQVACVSGQGFVDSTVAISVQTPFDTCAQCATGTFKDMLENTECERCPAGETTASEGSTSAQDCLCAPGFSPAYVEQAVVSGGNPCQGPINGVCTRNNALYNARPTYSKPGPGARHIYYVFRPSTQRYLWVISPSIGAVVFNAICQTNSTMVPLQNWQVACVSGQGFVDSTVAISVQNTIDTCEQCPTGKFSNSLNALCAECPAHSTTAAPASASASHCLCNVG